jgi:2,3-bisphosphoglycerate-independent phosphoglycerate mutase
MCAVGVVQVIDQGARLVDQALANGQMFELPGWKLISQAFPEHTVHFIGLLSDGGVHSRFDQLVGCVKGAVERGAKRIRIHILTGGDSWADAYQSAIICGSRMCPWRGCSRMCLS